jgi:bifunctional non-homologous end joining protein LigD
MIKQFGKPVAKKVVPAGPDWIHEVKYDGYRGRIIRDGKNVKLLSKSGLEWNWRFPWIVETALKIRQTRFVIDGEICVLDLQGISDFNALHSNRHNEEAQLYAFDLLVLDGEMPRDLRDAALKRAAACIIVAIAPGPLWTLPPVQACSLLRHPYLLTRT